MTNTLDTVARARQARQAVQHYDAATLDAVTAACPQVVRDNPRYTLHDWLVTVPLVALPWETPPEAAQRLGLYLALHHERHQATPHLSAIQRNSISATTQETP